MDKKAKRVWTLIIMGVGALIASSAQVFEIFGIKISGLILGGLIFLGALIYFLNIG